MSPKLSLSIIFMLSILFFIGVSSRLAVVMMGDGVVELTEYEEKTVIRKKRDVLPQGLVENPKQLSAN